MQFVDFNRHSLSFSKTGQEQNSFEIGGCQRRVNHLDLLNHANNMPKICAKDAVVWRQKVPVGDKGRGLATLVERLIRVKVFCANASETIALSPN